MPSWKSFWSAKLVAIGFICQVLLGNGWIVAALFGSEWAPKIALTMFYIGIAIIVCGVILGLQLLLRPPGKAA